MNRLAVTASALSLALLLLACAAPPRKPLPEDPYPADCAVVRSWLRENYGDDVEVTSWGLRTAAADPKRGDCVTIGCRFRPKGGRTKSAFFVIGPDGAVLDVSFPE